ncbi:MAG TPA: hypothetical protein VML96_09410 [Egibacteraceae bacterium]|nr:hypothetical protein [Egibacteraceae bacterium]
MVLPAGAGRRRSLNAPPTDAGDRLRSLNAPARVQVQAGPDDAPRALWLGRRRAVEAMHEAWRLDDEWWRPRPVSRLYYRINLDDGRIMTVFHDLVDDSWWTQRA